MFASWFSSLSIRRIGFDDVLLAVGNPETYLLINTLPAQDQSCLIRHTITISEEERVMNQYISSYQHYNKKVIVYGKNCADASVEKKYHQLTSLGFRDIFVYPGGMLEWMLLQDVFGVDEFPTTSTTTDLLRFQAPTILNLPRLTN